MSYGNYPGPGNPYNAPGAYGPGPGPGGFNPAYAQIAGEISSQATAAMVVGIISFFFCGIILGPFAIYRGSKALRLIREHNIGHEHSSKASAGKICGIIATVLNVLVLLFYAVVIIGAAATGGFQNP